MLRKNMNNINKTFWENYYSNNKDDIIKNSSFSVFINENIINKYNKQNVHMKICDLGSGNSRDSVYFSQLGNMCYMIDVNGVLNQTLSNCILIKEDVETVLKTFQLHTLVDIMYMRWFLHALPYDTSKKIFKYAVHNLKPNGFVCIEVRSYNDSVLKQQSIYDDNDKSFQTTHKRWLYTIEMCKEMAKENDCDVIYCDEGYFSNNARTETKNPLLIRMICRKRQQQYFKNSENYDKYKHIIPLMKSATMKSYTDMDKMNYMLEKYNIKYVAVAGTALGLVRHGGIIPWDNDIDIGFVEDEWKKLFSIGKELQKIGLQYRWNGENHCHFGEIDCFKLWKNNDYYDGDARTHCGVEEYKNVHKQIFGYTYIYAPYCSEKSLTMRYGNYFNEGNVNDNFHYKDDKVDIFELNNQDLCYQTK